jgi:hypothetical protein
MSYSSGEIGRHPRGTSCPSFALFWSLSNRRARPSSEGAGKAGCWSHPWVPCKTKSTGGRTTGEPERTRLSLRGGLRLTSCSPRRPGFLATFINVMRNGTACAMRRHHCRFNASVGASGPHDFVVREFRRSSRASLASTASHRNVRDDREPPLLAGETGEPIALICPTTEARCFCAEGWTGYW